MRILKYKSILGVFIFLNLPPILQDMLKYMQFEFKGMLKKMLMKNNIFWQT